MKQTKEQRAARKKAYYEANRERLAANKKIYYQENKERLDAKNKEYHQKNKEQIAAWKKEYRKRYYQTESGRESITRANKKYRDKLKRLREDTK